MAKHWVGREDVARGSFGAPLRMERAQGHIDLLECLFLCFQFVLDNPQASRRLLVLRDSETPWATCLQVLQREFPDLGYHFPAPKVAVVPPPG